MTKKEVLLFIDEELAKRSNEAYGKKMTAYMKGHFPHYGVRGPLRNEVLKLLKPIVKDWSIDDLMLLAHDLWGKEMREYQHVATDLLKWKAKKLTPVHIDDLEYMITNKSWWDSVDMIAPSMVGAILKDNKELQYEVAERWIASENMWLRRSAIIHQLKYKDGVDQDLLFALVESQIGSKEFFINKACGWALRQYAKFAPAAVLAFVNDHPKLAGLTRREALKHIM